MLKSTMEFLIAHHSILDLGTIMAIIAVLIVAIILFKLPGMSKGHRICYGSLFVSIAVVDFMTMFWTPVMTMLAVSLGTLDIVLLSIMFVHDCYKHFQRMKQLEIKSHEIRG